MLVTLPDWVVVVHLYLTNESCENQDMVQSNLVYVECKLVARPDRMHDVEAI